MAVRNRLFGEDEDDRDALLCIAALFGSQLFPVLALGFGIGGAFDNAFPPASTMLHWRIVFGLIGLASAVMTTLCMIKIWRS